MAASNEQPTKASRNEKTLKYKIQRTSSYEMEERVNNILSATNTENISNIDRESSISLKMTMINGGSTMPLTPDNELSFEYSNTTPNTTPPLPILKSNEEKNEKGMVIKYKYNKHNKPNKHNKHIFWRPICPFSISDKFVTVKDNTIGYIYSIVLEPDPYNTKFGILTPKTISNTLELPYIKFKIHYTEYMTSSPMSSNIKLSDKTIYQFNRNEWQWMLEFNKIIFEEILYPNLSNWYYSIKEIVSFELRNYFILPLKLLNGIDWNLMENIVKYYYSKHNVSYDIKQLLIDLGLISLIQKEETTEENHNKLSDIVLFDQNESYFVPLSESKQSTKIMSFIKRIIHRQRVDKMNTSRCTIQLQLLSLRFDKMDLMSLMYNNNDDTNKRNKRDKPRIDLIDFNRNGLFKAPFNANFFYSILRIPFILFQFERILCILQFIQSQQYLNKQPSEPTTFLMKIPLMVISKIIFQQQISVPHYDVFKYIGQQLLTLIYSNSSILILLLNDCNNNNNETDDNMIDITTDLMTRSVQIFRKTLDSNQIVHYLSPSPSHCRNSYWIPPNYYKTNDQPHNYYKFIAETVIGHNINEYISNLLYPIPCHKKVMQISNKYLFSIQSDLFSSIWYYNYGKMNNLNTKQLFSDCNNIINWMRIGNILHLSLQNIQSITRNLNTASKILRVSNEYSFFDFYKRSLLKEEKGYQSLKSLKSLKSLNTETQSLICNFIRNIEYEFEYPPILITIIDPFFILQHHQHKLTFQLLHDLGNIVLNVVVTLSVATNCYHSHSDETLFGMKKLLFYKKCLMSNEYLSHKCRLHQLYKHIITKNDKHNNNISSELIAEFMLSIIGAIYLDSNLHQLEKQSLNHNKISNINIPIQLQNVWHFMERFLPECICQEDIKNVIHLFCKRKRRNIVKYPYKLKNVPKNGYIKHNAKRRNHKVTFSNYTHK